MPLMRSLTALVVVGLALAMMHLASPVLTPVLFAFFLASLALPAYREGMQKRGVKRGLALIIMLIVLVAGGIALTLLALSAITHLQTGLAAYSGSLHHDSRN